MLTLALTISRHTAIRLEEITGALTAIAGGLFFLGSGLPFGRRGGQALGGLFLAAAGIVWVIAVRWGS